MCIISFIGKYGCSEEVITGVLLHVQCTGKYGSSEEDIHVITSSEEPYLPVNEIIHML
jgi:hypothetical protein